MAVARKNGIDEALKRYHYERSRKPYELNPKLCPYCKEALPYKKRRGIYCSRSCSAKMNNTLFPKRKKK